MSQAEATGGYDTARSAQTPRSAFSSAESPKTGATPRQYSYRSQRSDVSTPQNDACGFCALNLCRAGV